MGRGVEGGRARGRRRARRCRPGRPAPSAASREPRVASYVVDLAGAEPERPRPRRPGRPRTASTSASSTSRAGVGERRARSPRSSGLPRRGAALPSLGGSRISTGEASAESSLGWWHVLAAEWCGSTPDDEVARAVPARRDRADPGRAQGDAGRSRPRSRRRPAAAAARPRLPDLDRTDLPFVTIDPAVVDGPRPGAAPRARRRRLRRALRDRRRRGVRRSPATRSTSRPTSAARRSTAPTPRSRCTRPSLSEGAASLLPDQVRPGPAVDDPRRRHRRGHRRPRRAGAGAVDAPSSTTPASSRRSTTARADEVLLLLKEVGELRLQREAARGGISLPLPEQEVEIDRRPVVAGVPLADPGRELERPDLAAHRLRRGVADGLRPGRPAAHAAAARTRATSSGCTAPPGRCTSTGRPSSSTPTSSAASTPASPPRRR